MAGDLLITNIGELSTPTGTSARRGAEMSELRVVEDAAVLIKDGIIVYAGPGADVPWEEADGVPPMSADGRAVVPGFVDSHTHFVFAGYREDEFMWRAEGLPYMEIHKRGGGIRRSMDATRAASLEQLVEIGERRLWTMLSMGVTTVEGKSGYGLDLQHELKQLEAMSVLAERTPAAIVPTYLGAHAVPPEFEGRTSDYLAYMIEEVLPSVRAQGVARFCDVFCEKGVFDIEESRRYLEAGAEMGLGLKLHADEIEAMGGAGLAARLGAVSADHLLKTSKEDMAAMARAGVVATCLPLTSFALRENHADARLMIDSGCAVALASDLNPGSCYSQSIPLIFALGLLYMRLSLAEVLTALTLNGAAALGLAESLGSIESGKEGDLVILEARSARFLVYNTGMNVVSTVVKGGEIAYRA
ncbi:MAG TPA: imidazolonepropionase [Rectinemataceae bacterium]|nr:imidazolonepropionase [Rectinemataceae bacterium]